MIEYKQIPEGISDEEVCKWHLERALKSGKALVFIAYEAFREGKRGVQSGAVLLNRADWDADLLNAVLDNLIKDLNIDLYMTLRAQGLL